MSREIKYYGVHACLALWKKRPQDVIRVYLDPVHLKTFRPLLKWCAEQRKAYPLTTTLDLDKVSDSVHHEGVCVLAKELPPLTAKELLASLPKMSCLLYLDGVENPHNLGSILRTAAHFGVSHILGDVPALTPSACRIAKGAAEIVRLVPLDKPMQTIQALKQKGFALVATSPHGGTSLYQYSFPPRTLLALGSESRGVSPSFLKAADGKIQIPGSGFLESLNVAVAAGLCIGEYHRQHGPR